MVDWYLHLRLLTKEPTLGFSLFIGFVPIASEDSRILILHQIPNRSQMNSRLTPLEASMNELSHIEGMDGITEYQRCSTRSISDTGETTAVFDNDNKCSTRSIH
ncbi:hypothetical protein CEXT_503351 [Caerostris extrusa]|uniref:Ycf15 n=1 Tax=Caerostris extrusa TaxID=172846 RepID=A0AAV4QFN2_CAEEX|nr:hypothetical protein CEXT_503351 [Caerostris extrusa]